MAVATPAERGIIIPRIRERSLPPQTLPYREFSYDSIPREHVRELRDGKGNLRGIDLNFPDRPHQKNCFTYLVTTGLDKEGAFYVGGNFLDRICDVEMPMTSRPDTARFRRNAKGKWELEWLFEFSSNRGHFNPRKKIEALLTFPSEARRIGIFDRLFQSELIDDDMRYEVVVLKADQISVAFIPPKTREETRLEYTGFNDVIFLPDIEDLILGRLRSLAA